MNNYHNNLRSITLIKNMPSNPKLLNPISQMSKNPGTMSNYSRLSSPGTISTDIRPTTAVTMSSSRFTSPNSKTSTSSSSIIHGVPSLSNKSRITTPPNTNAPMPNDPGRSTSDTMSKMYFPKSMNCICERPGTKVYCSQCAFFLDHVRVHKKCEQHPMTMYLSDLKLCPFCKKFGTLREAVEHQNVDDEEEVQYIGTHTTIVEPEEVPSPPKEINANLYKRPSVGSLSRSNSSVNLTKRAKKYFH